MDREGCALPHFFLAMGFNFSSWDSFTSLSSVRHYSECAELARTIYGTDILYTVIKMHYSGCDIYGTQEDLKCYFLLHGRED